MNFVLLRSSAFFGNAKKIIKKQPELAANIQATLELLISDPLICEACLVPAVEPRKVRGNVSPQNKK